MTKETVTTPQSDDMLRGRIIAMRSMIAQCQNEINQLEDNLAARERRKDNGCGHIYVQGTYKYDTHTEVGKIVCVRCGMEMP